MTRLFRRSLRAKLLALIMLTTLASLVVAIGALIAYDLRHYHASALADAQAQAELLARTAAPAMTFDDPAVARENLDLMRFRPEVRAAALYTARGQMFASYEALPGHPFPALPESDGAVVRGSELVAFKRVVADREIVGTVYLNARYELRERFLGYLGSALVALLAAMAFAYGLSIFMQRVVTGPILDISGTAREVTERRNFALRAAKKSDDEIGLLAESFNTMLAEIERGTRDLESSNRSYAHEVEERGRAQQEVQRLNEELERRVNERTEQLQYTNAELESFCYTVSHDLRGPLRAIDGFSQALLEDFPKDVPEDAQRYLGRIRASTQRMGQLIEDLLNLSRVSRGELQRLDIDVSELARQVVADLQARDPARQVQVSIWDGMRAEGDGRLVKAALENLVGNAWKFTSKSERAAIEVGALRDGAVATYFVRDNGAGFDMKYANKLFGAFQRLHGANEYQGTGIGLATVQRIVHRHGGRVWADAQPGKGAVFFFTLEPGSGAPGKEKEVVS